MKKPLSYILLAVCIFSLNALPANAAQKKSRTKKAKTQLVITDGVLCFELPWMNLICRQVN